MINHKSMVWVGVSVYCITFFCIFNIKLDAADVASGSGDVPVASPLAPDLTGAVSPSGAVDPRAVDSRVVAPKSLDPKSLDSKSLDSKSLDSKSLDSKSLEPKGLDPKKIVTDKATKSEAAELEKDYKDHGWGKLDSVENSTPFNLKVYSIPRGLIASLPEGTIVRIKALKTGFGNFYRVKRDNAGIWRLAADTRDPNDLATQFLINHVDGGISLSSEVANGFLLESDPTTFDVTLKSDKESGNSVWELVEDPKAGDTLDTCFLRNRATKGLLTASYSLASGDDTKEIADLKAKIEQFEKDVPYLTITYARTEGILNSFEKDLSRDIKKKIQAKIQPWILDQNKKRTDITGTGGYISLTGNWVSDMSGISHTRWKVGAANYKRNRKVKIKYMQGADKTEKEMIFEDAENSKKMFEIIADVTKHPAWPLRLKLIELQDKAGGVQKLKTTDIARTGYSGKPFDINQWSKIAIQSVVGVAGSDEDSEEEASELGQDLKVVPAGQKTTIDLWAHKRPEFKGLGISQISDFGAGKIVSLGALYSQGVAWFSNKLPVLGQCTLFFRVVAEQGDVAVCFADSVEMGAIPTNVAYRVVFGAQSNNKTIIYKGNKAVQEVSKEQSAFARVLPGEAQLLWVSVNNGFIMAGQGFPGTNVIVSWRDPVPDTKIEFVGVSTFKTGVKFADFQQLADPITVLLPQKFYVQDNQAIQVGAKDSPVIHKFPLSPLDAGTVVFQAKTPQANTQGVVLTLANDKNDGYQMVIGADALRINRMVGGRELYKVEKQEGAAGFLNDKDFSKIWISFYKGLFIAGSGAVGSNVFCVYLDPKAARGIYKIGFSGDASVQNLEIWPEVELGFAPSADQYLQKRAFAFLKGSLNVIAPFDYKITQEGPQVFLEDKFVGQEWSIAATPEPDAEYRFSLGIKATGEPEVKLASKKVSETTKTKKIMVEVLDKTAEVAFLTGQTAAMGTTEYLIPSLIAISAASAATVAATALSTGSAVLKGDKAEADALANRSVYTQAVQTQTVAAADVKTEAGANKKDVVRKMDEVSKILADSEKTPEEQRELVVRLWGDILRLITDFYVIEDSAIKQRIITGIMNIYNMVIAAAPDKKSLLDYKKMRDVLIKAYNSPYLTRAGDVLEEQQRLNWYAMINNLFKNLYNCPLLAKDGIDVDFRGGYFIVPVEFPVAGRGSISFEAKGYNNIFVEFIESPAQVLEKMTRMYEIVIGMNDNKITAIHRKKLGDSVAEFDHKKYPDLSPDPSSFKKYWINVDNGAISMGVGDLGQNKLWEWKDPYPSAPVKWVGLSNWLGMVTFRNIKVGSVVGVK